ncbi:MAG TPA: LysR family transcriptional regulator, partial [Xanthomonadaceae bacterium]|nr:LysR family transcriptional regulator [Xanthomonadaceae bacterium]
MRRTGLTEFDAVLAVSRRGSFRAAARELGMSTSAISAAVAALEQRLAVRLF